MNGNDVQEINDWATWPLLGALLGDLVVGFLSFRAVRQTAPYLYAEGVLLGLLAVNVGITVPDEHNLFWSCVTGIFAALCAWWSIGYLRSAHRADGLRPGQRVAVALEEKYPSVPVTQDDADTQG